MDYKALADSYINVSLRVKKLKKQIKDLEQIKSKIESDFSQVVENNPNFSVEGFAIFFEEKIKFKTADNSAFVEWCKSNGYSDKVKEQVAPASMVSIAKKSPSLPEGLVSLVEKNIKISKS